MSIPLPSDGAALTTHLRSRYHGRSGRLHEHLLALHPRPGDSLRIGMKHRQQIWDICNRFGPVSIRNTHTTCARPDDGVEVPIWLVTFK